jgi:predicted permease
MNMWSRLAAYFRRNRELQDEIANHLAMQEEEFRRSGMDANSAHLAALKQFGGVTQTREACQGRRGLPWLEIAVKDVRFALRGLKRNPGFTAAAVLSLALGIGANTAIFSLFHAMLLRMLPVARPHELVSLYRTGGWGKGHTSYPLYLEVAKRSDLFQAVVGRTGVQKVRFGAGAEFARREYVTGNYFAVLGVTAAIGRVFSEDKRSPEAVLSYDFWRNRFGANPAVLGQAIKVDEQPFTVIGVAQPGFHGVELEQRADVWAPILMAPGNPMEPGRNWVFILARRRADVSRQAIQSAANAIMQAWLEAKYGNSPVPAFRKVVMQQRLEVRDAGVGLSLWRDRFAQPLWVLMAAVGVALLAACANVANLLLARAARREKELALRIALGATRGRLIRQALTESLLLAAGGCVFGVLFAIWAQRTLVGMLPVQATLPVARIPEPAILAFTIAISIIAALVFGLTPALQWGKSRLRRPMVVAQVAFSVVLVVLAGLFGRTLAAIDAVELGFHGDRTIAFSLDFPRTWTAAQTHAARTQFLTAAENLPGVASVSHGFPAPFQGGSSFATIFVPGFDMASADITMIGPRYFETLGARLERGREFDLGDTDKSKRVVIVNEAFARRFFAGDPIGRMVSFDQKQQWTIVGVAPDLRYEDPRKDIKAMVYTPDAQMNSNWEPTVLLRARVQPAELAPTIRRELLRFGPQVASSEPLTIARQIDDSIFEQRMLAALGGFFGLLALVLAAVGLWGVAAYGVARRAREIGIRMALGARRTRIVGMVLRDSLTVFAIGMLVGAPAAFAAARAVSSLLYGVKPADPATFILTGAALLVTTFAATAVPARRAAGLDPNKVLRTE